MYICIDNHNNTPMDKLEEIYNKITYLRQKKVSMKTMAQACNMYQSVFSAIYTTVIPHYLENIKKGNSHEEAIDDALSWVNNVSKKKLTLALDRINSTLKEIKPTLQTWDNKDELNSFLSYFVLDAKESQQLIGNYTGIYMGYSMSSLQKVMKAEPYIIMKSGNYVKVGYKSIFNKVQWGYAIRNNINHLYFIFNGIQCRHLTLRTIFIKLPRFVHTDFMRGICLSIDCNDAPIAQRIIFIKQNAIEAPDSFNTLKSHLIYPEQMSEEEKLYYNYTCQESDVIRMKEIENPQMSPEDLLYETDMKTYG